MPPQKAAAPRVSDVGRQVGALLGGNGQSDSLTPHATQAELLTREPRDAIFLRLDKKFALARQRPHLLEFLTSTDASRASLRRDDCGDWAIFGSHGHVYEVPGGFQLVVSTGESARRWSAVKNKLRFCQLTQGGDDEGCFILNRLPTKNEAPVIREALGIRKARRLSEGHLQKLLAAGVKNRFQSAPPSISTPAGTTLANHSCEAWKAANHARVQPRRPSSKRTVFALDAPEGNTAKPLQPEFSRAIPLAPAHRATTSERENGNE